jgi:hypothetical protein
MIFGGGLLVRLNDEDETRRSGVLSDFNPHFDGLNS